MSRGHSLVARLDNVGDVLLAGPAIRAVAHGSDSVTLLCSSTGAAAGEMLPGVDRIETVPAPWIAADPAPVEPAAMHELVDLLAGLHADRLIIFTSHHQSALPLALLGRMAGFCEIGAISPEYPGSLLDVRHRVDDDLHEVQRNLSLAARMGFEPAPQDDRLLRVDGVRRHLTTRAGVPYVVVHPGASVPARTWEPERFAELVGRLTQSDLAVFITGAARERGLAGPARKGVVDLCGRTDLPSLASVLAHAQVVVTGNTGPAHLAAAVGTPVVSIFPPTVPAVRWRPWGVPHVLLGDQQIPCAGCRARVCPIPGHPCVGTLTSERVLEAVRELAPAARAVGVAS
jgi:ADP-heptose:LPS heptosyltransferase